jgi:tripartite-type tricarboxylate transporter receptor subunit TctC
MKKLITLALSAIISTAALAEPKVVQAVWPFAIGSSQANLVRGVIDNANKQQDKYKFVFVNKPGAGGAIAANTVLEANELQVLFSSSSFYVRPLLYKDSHDVEKFKLVSGICMAQPFAIYSKKLNNAADLKRPQDSTVGVIPGSITTLITKTIKRDNAGFAISEVPYKGTPEATTDMLGGHIDAAVDTVGKSVTARFGPEVKALGITGRKSHGQFTTFQAQGVKGLEELVGDYLIFVPSTVDASVREELNTIFNNALGDNVKEICEDDYGYISKISFAQADVVHQANKSRWANLTKGIPRE